MPIPEGTGLKAEDSVMTGDLRCKGCREAEMAWKNRHWCRGRQPLLGVTSAEVGDKAWESMPARAGCILGRSLDIVLKIRGRFTGALNGQVQVVVNELNLHVLSQRVWR